MASGNNQYTVLYLSFDETDKTVDSAYGGSLKAIEHVLSEPPYVEPDVVTPFDAYAVPYTPAEPGDWPDPDPTNVGEALDDLAGGGGGASALDDLTDVTITTPSTGQVLKYDGAEWVNDTLAGSGDVVGPGSATNLAIALFDGTTGKLIKNSVVTIDGSGNISTAGTVDGYDVSVLGAKLATIEAGADITDAANVTAAGAVMDVFTTYGSTQTLVPSSTILATADKPYTPIDSGTGVTLSSEPHIAAGTNGQLVILKNVGGYNITVKDVNALGGCGFRLGSSSQRTLTPGGTLALIYDSVQGFWIEQYFLNPATFTPRVNTFTIDGVATSTTREVAAASTADATPDFDMTYVGSPSAASIDIQATNYTPEIVGSDYPITVPSPFLTLNSGTSPPSKSFYRGDAVDDYVTFRVTATVAGTSGLTKDVTVTYKNRRYIGPNTSSTTLTTGQVLALDGAGGTSDLTDSRAGTFSVSIGASEYAWYALRAALGTGTLYFKNNTADGEVMGFTQKQTTLSHTNDLGFTENFQTWKSDIANLGSISIGVQETEPNNRIYMGPAVGTDPISSANILALDGASGDSQVDSTVAGSYNVTITGTDYLWFCHPARIADLSTIKDHTTGFGIAGAYKTNVSHTNDFGYTETYRCWRSDSAGIFPAGRQVDVT